MLTVKVENMTSNSGSVPNQFIISTDDGLYFQSYDSVIALKKDGKVYLDQNYWDYSVTTGKYRNKFLSEDKKTTQKKIDSGEYILTDLN